MTSLFASGSRLCALVPRIARSFTTVLRPVPAPRGTPLFPLGPNAKLTATTESESITTASEFLKAIGRSAETKLSVESWEELWGQNGPKLKAAGLGIRDRRYILWCMEKYRSGLPVEDFAHDPKPKKTIRGWGPSVQNGKRIRSRRDRSKKKRPKSSP
ncbi:hypothetical protein C8J57DRAFT_1115557 [Mycena rebaudengoi]|nr:hypothetical protein C8J57DRAFT_1115557 [Mycena rebaudengoi]